MKATAIVFGALLALAGCQQQQQDEVIKQLRVRADCETLSEDYGNHIWLFSIAKSKVNPQADVIEYLHEKLRKIDPVMDKMAPEIRLRGKEGSRQEFIDAAEQTCLEYHGLPLNKSRN